MEDCSETVGEMTREGKWISVVYANKFETARKVGLQTAVYIYIFFFFFGHATKGRSTETENRKKKRNIVCTIIKFTAISTATENKH